ncbi:MAG: septal ring lytic transglycosylase RlpA family protein [Alphaproteobacteria bacterium]|nr:septal ring lytic transglycosylase RlpA family protein [Alphaproteobacteria bacterium]
MYFSRFFVLSVLCLVLAACASGGQVESSASHGGGSQTSGEGGIYKVGQPYQIDGEWYYPKEDFSYDETGIASWYGADFHGLRTANGEVYNKNELTAAHKTLPLPTLARVTNLDNGRSIVVRINDRGPYSSGRIIDMSQRAAQLLGFEQQGTAKVRVQVLADESKAIADAMRHYGSQSPQLAAAQATPATSQPVEVASAERMPAPLATAPVQRESLSPVITNAATHQRLLETKPLPEVVQLPVTSHNRIFIQAGAFTVQANALRLQESLTRFGPTSITEIVINGTKFYRVRIGPVADVDHADSLLAKVHQSGVAAARTIVD